MSTEESKTEEEKEEEEEEEDASVFLAFARIYSGTLHRGQEVFILHPRHDPRNTDPTDPLPLLDPPGDPTADGATPPRGELGEGEEGRYVEKVTISELYILMGRGVVEVEAVPAGNILGIAGLDQHVLKSATVSTTTACPAFRPMSFAAAPILRVAMEPLQASDTAALSRGMKLLNQADASVEISLQPTGEFILSTAGEVHLQRCLDDLRGTFAKVKLRVSSPIVPFRETIVPPPRVDARNEVISDDNVVRLTPANPLLSERETSNGGLVTIQTPNKASTLVLEARPLPEVLTGTLSSSTALLRALQITAGANRGRGEESVNSETLKNLRKLRRELAEEFARCDWCEFGDGETVDRMWGCGPKGTGANVLLCGLPDYRRGSVWRGLEGEGGGLQGYDHSIVFGFQLACQSGPLCEEPLRGVCFILRDWSYVTAAGGEGEGAALPESSSETNSSVVSDTYGPFSGQLISAMKEGCRRAFLSRPARLMAAMYTCHILATAEVLGKLYAVLGRRNGRVCSEEMREGSTVFNVQAVVPVAESFGFADEVRKRTSGLASPQLVFSHWEVSEKERHYF